MVYIYLTRYLTVLSNAVHYLNNSVSDEIICILIQTVQVNSFRNNCEISNYERKIYIPIKATHTMR